MIRKVAAIYSIIVGLSMLGMWFIFYATGSIPELATEPARIILHLAAEIVTAIALIVAGWALITTKKWSLQLYLMATGALIYTMIQSPGYFLHSGKNEFVTMFAILLLLSLLLLIYVLRESVRSD